MCGKPKVDTTYQDFQIAEAARSRAEEDARKARIDEGMKEIAAIFGGGEYVPYIGEFKATGLNTGDKKYKDDVWAFEMPTERGEARVYEGMTPYLEQRRKAQMDYYMPQLDRRRDDAQEQLTFALARAGLLNSTGAGERQADLSEDYALQRGSLLSRIASDIAGTQTQMNQQRSAIEAGLRASGDATAAANQALQAAVTFRQDQPQLDPLGHLFYGIAEGIGAARNGQEVERIKRLATPSPLNTNSGRLVG